jgi:energy-coupling factor transport system permease protein
METYHPATWLAWLAAAVLAGLLTRNPLYLILALLSCGVTYLALERRSPTAQSWGAFVKLGALLMLFTVPWNALNVHYGDLVLFRLPSDWPLFGGPITAEAALYGLSNGLSLLVILLVFATFSTAVDQARLLRMMPAFLQMAGVTAAVAMSFVPQMVIASRDIRESQRIRGHRFRGLRSLLPLFMPLLATGLERAISLAESMEARGFGRAHEGEVQHASTQNLVTVLALLVLAAGAFGYAYFAQYREWSGGLIILAVVALLCVFRAQGRSVRRTRYQRWRWRGRDTVVMLASVAALVGLLCAKLFWPETLVYYPYPPFSPWPDFRPLVGIALVTLAVPGLLMPASVSSPRGASNTQMITSAATPANEASSRRGRRL